MYYITHYYSDFYFHLAIYHNFPCICFNDILKICYGGFDKINFRGDEMNFMIKQLVVEVEDSLVSFIEDIEQIQEDLPEEEKIFSQLEKLKERLKSDLDFLEKINH